MILFPAIDILDNRAVRLKKGLRDNVTIYGNPVEIAKNYQKIGAQYLHIVDLNGAFDNSDINCSVLKEIRKSVNIPIQLGGGVKTMEKIDYYLSEINVDRVILGTVCITNKELVKQAVLKYKNRIIASIDAKDNFVATHGWVGESNINLIDLALELKEIGIDTLVYTDISRDGCLTGVNYEKTLYLQQNTGMNVIASGGLKDINDIIILKEKNIYGAILGKALYENKFTLEEALKI